MIKIGTTLYCRDYNYRPRDGSRNFHMRPSQVTGETRASWLVGTNKVNKKTMFQHGSGGYGGYQWYTEAGMNDYIWAEKHGLNIASAVTSMPTDVLKKIAALMGYDEATETFK